MNLVGALLYHTQKLGPLLATKGMGQWHSLDFVDETHVEMLFQRLDGVQLILQCIHPASVSSARLHPHRWPSATLMLPDSGRCLHLMGCSANLEVPKVILRSTFQTTPDTDHLIEMDNPDAWHAFIPLDKKAYFVTVTGPKWSRPMPAGLSNLTRSHIPDPRKVVLLAEFSACELARRLRI